MTKTAHLRVYTPESSEDGDPVPAFVRGYGLLSETERRRRLGSGVERAANGVPAKPASSCPRVDCRLRQCVSGSRIRPHPRRGGAGRRQRASPAITRSIPSHRSHVLTSAWHVPVRWFTAFQPEDKEVYEVDGAPRIRLRVDLAVGRKRVDHALGVLRGLQVFQGPAEELAQLSDWIESFPSGSMLELDYSTVSDLFAPQELVFDDSVELVRRSIEALADGDMMAAGENYGRVVSRWAPAFSVTFSS